MDLCSIKPQPGGRFILELVGSFPPEWTGSLCARLSARRIDVERGFAKQVQRGLWESQFVLRPLDPGIDLLTVKYRDMALAPKLATPGARPRLTSFELDDRGDALGLTIRARDELGFLGRVLSAFSFQMLFVHEMHIETVGLEAHDTFVLKGLAGAAPARDQRARLAAALEAMSAAPEALRRMA